MGDDIRVSSIVHYVEKSGTNQGEHLAALVVKRLDDGPTPVVNLAVFNSSQVLFRVGVTFDAGTQVRGTYHPADYGTPIVSEVEE